METPDPASEPKAFLRTLFDIAVRAVDPVLCMRGALPEAAPAGRVLVLGGGKASAAMAEALEEHAARHWPETQLRGLIVTQEGCEAPCKHIEVITAGHPDPDSRSLKAAERTLELAQSAGEDDFVIHLVSGGGSSLLALPAPGVSFEDMRAVNTALLRSGAPIADINCVRKHLSAVKGGRLALAAAPARQLTLAVSDAPGDEPDAIASGPTVPDTTTFTDARNAAARWRLELPKAVKMFLYAGIDETPKPGGPGFERTQFKIIARAHASLEAAAAAAEAAGCDAEITDEAAEGEAREVARTHARLAMKRRAAGVSKPLVLISGGETTVHVRGEGRGGRNTEYLLAFALETDDAEGIYALACDTDGIDGSEDNAGALFGPGVLAEARRKGVTPRVLLAENDSYSFFEAAGGLIVTGLTRTNVDDFRASLILPP